MYNTVIVRYGEIWTKSEVTRRKMESILLENIKRVLSDTGYEIRRGRGRIYIDTEEAEAAADKLSRVFGVVSVSPAITTSKELEAIQETAKALAKLKVKKSMSFAVRVHRSDKSFPWRSIELERKIGSVIKSITGASVDLSNPDLTIGIEISDKAYVFDQTYDGPGGLPYGSQGKAVVLFSGGIDSPVAAWLMARRGLSLDFLFINPGLPEPEANALEIASLLRERWYIRGEFYVADVPDLILQIAGEVKEGLRQVVLKRFMYRIGEKLASEIGALAIVTGESLGQVSSQTLRNLCVIEEAVRIPVLRPLIGMNKDDSIKLARRIGTYDLSIRVKEFCSLEKHSNASARLKDVLEEESKVSFDLESLVFRKISVASVSQGYSNISCPSKGCSS